MAEDRTSYSQSLMHMIKGNLGAGVLGIGCSFMNLGLVGAMIALPALCVVSCHCVHLLIKAADSIEPPTKSSALPPATDYRSTVDYPSLTRRGLAQGPNWMRGFSKALGQVVETTLLMTQIGVCCVYIVFVVDNMTSILATYHVHISKSMAFLCILPVTLVLSFIRTLQRLALASMAANLLQFVGLALIIEFLVRDLGQVNLRERDSFRPLGDMALGFGTAMFAFEGIGTVLPIYSRMRHPKHALSNWGVVNVSYLVFLVLYFVMGLLSYIKYGRDLRDSITLNLPAEPLYDLVRAMFTASILLSYPLQFYVPNEMIWKWARANLLAPLPAPNVTSLNSSPLEASRTTSEKLGSPLQRPIDIVTAKGEQEKQQQQQVSIHLDATNLAQNKELGLLGSVKLNGADEKERLREELLFREMQASASQLSEQTGEKKSKQVIESNSKQKELQANEAVIYHEAQLVRYEYCCRIALVLITFTLAASVPKLNLLMDLIGSFSGTTLCMTMPATIHMAVFWRHTKGSSKCLMLISNSLIIVFSLCAGLGGSVLSLMSIIRGH